MISSPVGSHQPSLSLKQLIAAAGDVGIPAEAVLAGTGETKESLDGPDHPIALESQFQAVRNALALYPDLATLGIATGTRINLTQLGLLGFAALASSSVRELTTIALRFFSLTNLVLQIHIDESSERTLVSLQDDHIPEELRRFFAMRDIAGIISVIGPILQPVLSEQDYQVAIRLTSEDSRVIGLLESLEIAEIIPDNDRREIEFLTCLLDEPLPQADPHTVALCIAQCEQILAARSVRSGLSSEVRSMILRSPEQPPRFEEAAAAVHLHPRTLRRRLAEEGTTYRALLAEVRRELAAELLLEVGLTVEQVSRRLGYSDTAAFTHAFTGWFGTSPTAYRRESGGQPRPHIRL